MRTLIRFVFLIATCGMPMSGRALYDPVPLAALSAIEGAWQGTLEYRDYQPPNRRVILPTRLMVALSSPMELTLHYIFDDGPKKTVHSYDRLMIDFDAATVRFSGLKAEDSNIAKVMSSKEAGGTLEIIADRVETSTGTAEVTRYTLRLGKSTFEIHKSAGPKDGEGEFRNRYIFRR